MEDLNIDEVKQLVNFYRQKASDLELQILQIQLKNARSTNLEQDSIPATKITKTKSDS